MDDTTKENYSALAEKKAIYGRFYQNYYFLVYSLCLSFLHDDNDAREVTGDVFGKIWMSGFFLKENAPFVPYLSRMAKNAAIDYRRRQKRHPLYSSPEEVVSPANSLASEMDLEDLLKLISFCLNEKEMIVFLGHAEKEQSFDEIASTMGISVNAATSLYTRAKEKLAKAIEKQERAPIGDEKKGKGGE